MESVLNSFSKVLVTGATGMLGRSVVAALLERGHRVRAMVRPATNVTKMNWPTERIEIYRADLRSPPVDLHHAFDGIDALIHLAAVVGGSDDARFAGTVGTTERLLEAMRQSFTRRIILAGSMSVYDWSRIEDELTENSPLEESDDLYTRDGYAIAKVWQERVVRRFAAENNRQLTVMRPGFIWPHGDELMAGVGMDVGSFHVVVGRHRAMPITFVDNCADAFVTAMEKPNAIGETFNVVDGHDIDAWDFTRRWLDRNHRNGTRIPVPYGVGLAAAHVATFISKLAFNGRGKLPSILMPCRFEARFKPGKFSNEKLRRVLNWSPPLSFDQAMAQGVMSPEPAEKSAG